MTEFLSVVLEEHHALNEFDCGVPVLDRWLVDHAMRANLFDIARTYVWTEAGSDRAVAYYSIAPHQVHMPAYLLARLALDRGIQGRGLGGDLLRDALERVVEAAEVASGRLLVVDAIDDQASKFYRKYDFQPVKDNPRRLVIKIATVRKALFG